MGGGLCRHAQAQAALHLLGPGALRWLQALRLCRAYLACLSAALLRTMPKVGDPRGRHTHQSGACAHPLMRRCSPSRTTLGDPQRTPSAAAAAGERARAETLPAPAGAGVAPRPEVCSPRRLPGCRSSARRCPRTATRAACGTSRATPRHGQRTGSSTKRWGRQGRRWWSCATRRRPRYRASPASPPRRAACSPSASERRCGP